MNPLDKLSGEMEELLDGFMTQTVVGDATVGLTNYIFWMCVALALLVITVLLFKKMQAKSLVPQGIFVNGMELVVEFVRDDLCESILGETWKKHFPFLAALFFFIVSNSIVGVIPGCHPGTGTIGVTAALAFCSFVYFVVLGCRRMGVAGYIKSLAPEGVAFPMNLLVWVIELVSTFLRLVTLAVRLFCNMFAGHVVMGTFAILATLFVEPLLQKFSLVALGYVGASVFWVVLLIIIYLVEILVGVIQAYVFTLLSAVYIQIVENE
ncbi:F0F1 ATP synthase subunit A [Olsenella sp. HMSC062G07]|uniref:F0F1 ATP synthase subunit A n=1 Tax=Olsenella sp. HMSC062G07 TaxID=1739330 RepID=UPI0008A45A93|nr:F0F1 ATP synthase subunit A [Olsenella sp. HMSC062G07]OFK22033.1 ATP synthase F0 subunit A [Olsenella sp. HMSC062G07]